MYIVQISDRERFIKQANDKKAVVQVTRIVGTVPISNNEDEIFFAPCMQFFYQFHFEDGEFGTANQWNFQEVIIANSEDEISKISDTMKRFNKYVIAKRSGSV